MTEAPAPDDGFGRFVIEADGDAYQIQLTQSPQFPDPVFAITVQLRAGQAKPTEATLERVTALARPALDRRMSAWLAAQR